MSRRTSTLAVSAALLVAAAVLLWSEVESREVDAGPTARNNRRDPAPRYPSVRVPVINQPHVATDHNAHELDYAGPVSTDPGTVRARVLLDGRPVTNFMATAGSGWKRFQTADGAFEIEALGNVSRTMSIVADGTEMFQMDFDILPNERHNLGDIDLVPAGIIRGRVVDRNNFPVEHALVALRAGNVSIPREARTDREGWFEVQAYGGDQSVFVTSDRGNGFAKVTEQTVVRLVPADDLPAE